MEEIRTSVFTTLSAVNVNGHTEKKNGLTYLSWAWAWAELLKRYPDSTYTVYENRDGWCYHTDGRTAWVKTGVTVEGKEYVEMLPVMDVRNRSIPLENVTSMDVNKAIQRSLTKAVARHGLGLYIYAGEDIPEDAADDEKEAPAPQPRPTKTDSALAMQRKKVMDYARAKFGDSSDILPQLGAKLFPNRGFTSLTIPELQGLFDAMKEFEEGVHDQEVC